MTPTFQFSIRDNNAQIEYVVLAYREVTRDEALLAIQAFRASKQGKKLIRGQRYTIQTSIGAV